MLSFETFLSSGIQERSKIFRLIRFVWRSLQKEVGSGYLSIYSLFILENYASTVWFICRDKTKFCVTGRSMTMSNFPLHSQLIQFINFCFCPQIFLHSPRAFSDCIHPELSRARVHMPSETFFIRAHQSSPESLPKIDKSLNLHANKFRFLRKKNLSQSQSPSLIQLQEGKKKNYKTFTFSQIDLRRTRKKNAFRQNRIISFLPASSAGRNASVLDGALLLIWNVTVSVPKKIAYIHFVNLGANCYHCCIALDPERCTNDRRPIFPFSICQKKIEKILLLQTQSP